MSQRDSLPDQGSFIDGSFVGGGGHVAKMGTGVRCSWYPTPLGWGWSATCSWGGNVGQANTAEEAERSARKAMEWFESVSRAPDEGERCPKCGRPSASPPAEVYCVECATEGYEKDAAAWRASPRQRATIQADPNSYKDLDQGEDR